LSVTSLSPLFLALFAKSNVAWVSFGKASQTKTDRSEDEEAVTSVGGYDRLHAPTTAYKKQTLRAATTVLSNTATISFETGIFTPLGSHVQVHPVSTCDASDKLLIDERRAGNDTHGVFVVRYASHSETSA